MKAKTLDYSIFEKLNFSRSPVGIKFLPHKPEGIERINKSLYFCQMFKEAQDSSPFYVQREDFHCTEPLTLGMEDPDPVLLSGMVGEKDDLYAELRANQRIYQYVPRMLKGSVKCVLFSSIDKLTFDPDVLVITADNADQARILLRALVYTTGDMWSSKGTPVLACSWMYVYPYLSGEVNYTVTGFSMGMQTLKVLPQGLIIISIPWQKLPMIMENLKIMNWHPLSERITEDDHKKRFESILKEITDEIGK
ncbi:MAG: DUF169 domain-containing protein [Dehalococcoidales bacterium]|nr:DUF169 domain-containing protein [Dehalococcoidales bacterium]